MSTTLAKSRAVSPAFKPARVFLQPRAMDYAAGRRIVARLQEMGVPIKELSSSRVVGIPGQDERQAFFEAKRSVVLAVRSKANALQGCRPSANYQLPLMSGCVGHCHYCYLHTSFGPKPYVRIYVNREEIFGWAEEHIERRKPFVTIFEGAATSDPIPLEPWSGAMREAIEHFAQHPYGRFRFVTKYDQVDTLLDLDHRGHTRIRFTVNTRTVTRNWDKATARLERRLVAARKVAEAGYPYGFIVGPVVAYPGWEEEYARLIEEIAEAVPSTTYSMASFEIVTHRFTPRAKELIESVYPATDLPMAEEEREWRYGQFGYGKWVYPKEVYERAKALFFGTIPRMLPGAGIMYLV